MIPRNDSPYVSNITFEEINDTKSEQRRSFAHKRPRYRGINNFFGGRPRDEEGEEGEEVVRGEED